MPRPRKYGLTADESRSYAFRLPNALADAFEQLLAGQSVGEWARIHIAGLVGKGPRTKSDALLAGYDEGKRQGWAAANAAFRKALEETAEKLKG
jgi:hypothetical protein